MLRCFVPALALLLFAPPAPIRAEAPIAADEPVWQRMAREDLDFIHGTLARHHPGPVDAENPGFSDWHAQGYAQALSRLPEVRGFGAWQHLLRLYVEGFADEHLALEFWLDFRWPAWAGITLAWNGERFEVREAPGDVELPRGALLASCDGRSAEALWQSNVAPFYARAERPALRFRHAHRLLLSNGNPLVQRPARCLFEVAGEVREIELAWRSDPASLLPTGPVTDQGRTASLSPFGERGVWLRLPTFGPRGTAAETLAATLQKLSELQDVETLVIDVRGNGGGSSHWTEVFLRALQGDAYFEHSTRLFQQAQGAVALDYRVSPENLAHFESLMPIVLQQAGEGSEAHAHFSAVIEGLRDGIATGQALHRVQLASPEPLESAATEPRFEGRILLLTDHSCASACLSFVERVLQLPRVTHAGQPTSADTPYMEVRGATLPSNLGALSFATKVYRGRSRSGSGDFRPTLAYVGDLSDDAAVEAWLLEQSAMALQATPTTVGGSP